MKAKLGQLRIGVNVVYRDQDGRKQMMTVISLSPLKLKHVRSGEVVRAEIEDILRVM